jgi:multidrug efflux pump
MDKVLGGFFRRFNNVSEGFGFLQRRRQARDFAQGSRHGRLSGADRRHRVLFRVVPGGFVPLQDKQYLIGFAQLQEGATLDRTEEVMRQMSAIAMQQPGVESAVAFPACRSTASPTHRAPASCSRR